MRYILAVSFSNIQFYYGLPTIFVGLAFDSANVPDLSSAKTKEDLFPDLNKLPEFDLAQLENELTKYDEHIVSYKVVNFKRPKRSNRVFSWTSERFLDGYLEVIAAVLSSNLPLSSEGIKKCYVHAPINRDGEPIVVQKALESSHPVFKYPLGFQSKGNFNQFTHLARLFAVYEYLKKRRIRKRFIYSYVRNANTDLLQVTRILWKSPSIQHYAGSFVGYPDLIVKTPTGYKKIPLVTGEEINIFPIARFCLGFTDKFRDKPCVQSSNKRPFGTTLTGRQFESCASCSEKTMPIRCLSRTPKCDGSQVLCGNNSFAGNVCNGNFAIYFSIFNNVLKVGRCILSRTVGRLLEQTALDGLIFYPVNSIEVAHMIEKNAATYLRSKIKHLSVYGITRVARSVKIEDRFEQVRSFSKHITRLDERKQAYYKIARLLENADRPEIRSLFALKSRDINLLQNWLIDETQEIDQTDLIREPQFKRIEGRIEGIVGSFVLVNEKAYSLNGLQGFVVQWQ